jgi:ribose/xylose/arabinose/galactoside ABC-type transport system permease subunit
MNTMTPKSGLFLACSCIAAIAAVGSIFELSSGQPDLGTQVTAIILAASIPLTGLFFIAAVKDTKANMNK